MELLLNETANSKGRDSIGLDSLLFFGRSTRVVLTSVLALSVCLAEAPKPARRVSEARQSQARPHDSIPPRKQSPAGPQCETKGEEHITITCNYRAISRSVSNRQGESEIALDRAVISFRPDDSSNMLAKLTLTNRGTAPMLDTRTVYLTIDDDAGNNYVRRTLPTVDLRKLSPGKEVTFSEQLRVAAFPPGGYTIALWIPSSEPALKFNPAHNLLISSAGVADSQKGLNILAKFTVEKQRY